MLHDFDDELNEKISSALYYGYSPDCDCSGLPDAIQTAVQKKDIDTQKKDIIEQGYNALQNSITDELQQTNSDTHVVPLSAGLDSRAVLALLLSHNSVNNEQIQTVTFGTPGTWDYEIGQQVAAAAGVKNHTIDLTDEAFDWSESSLQSYAETLSSPNRVFEGFVNYSVSMKFDNAEFWSGFMGDPTAGAHQPADPSEDWNSACEHFASWNEWTNRLCLPGYDPLSELPDEPYLSREMLSYEEQLDFAHRQQCFIAPIVLPKPERYRTPFMQTEWLSFSLNLPATYRTDRRLFKKIVTEKFPSLFQLPTDATGGLSPTAGVAKKKITAVLRVIRRTLTKAAGCAYISPSMNYIDFEGQFRQTSQLGQTVASLIEALSGRDQLVPADQLELWEQHQNGQDRSVELRILCAIELFLRTQ